MARELPSNTQLVVLLVGMLGKDNDWRQVQPPKKSQPTSPQQQQESVLLRGRLGVLHIDACEVDSAGAQVDAALESEVLAQAHAAGVCGCAFVFLFVCTERERDVCQVSFTDVKLCEDHTHASYFYPDT